MNQLTITVAGAHASGKSRVLYILKEFLIEKGFNVALESTIDYNDEKCFDDAMYRTINQTILALADSTKIIFKEVNLNREIISPICE